MKIKRFKDINENFNLDIKIFSEIVHQIEDSYDWDYVEHEGKDRVRFDWGNDSLWVNIDNTFDGNVPNNEIKMILKNRGIVNVLDEGIFSRYKDDDFDDTPKQEDDDISLFSRYKDDDFDDTPHPEYRNLVNELENVTKKYQVHMDEGDIKKALLEVVDIYDEDMSNKYWNR